MFTILRRVAAATSKRTMMVGSRLRCAVLAALLTAGAGAPGVAAPIKLKMAEVVRSQFYMPMYVAMSKGFVADEGLEVEFVLANGGDRVGALLLANQVDFALAGPEVPVYIYNGESPDKPYIFCALTATDGLFLMSKQKIDKFDWSMLQGKKVMGYRPGSTPGLFLEYVMKTAGKVDDATIKSMTTNITPTAREGAWIGGNWDFGIFNEPFVTTAEKTGVGYFAASVGKTVGRADYTVFFAKKSWIEKNPEATQKWTNAIARAQAWVKTASAQEIADAVKPFFPSLPVEDNLAVVNRFRNVGVPIWAESAVVDKAGLAKTQEIMVVGGVLPAGKEVAYDKIMLNTFAEKADAQFRK